MRGVNGKELSFDLMREERLQLILQMRRSGISFRLISTHLKKLVTQGQPVNPENPEGPRWHAPKEWHIEHVQVRNEYLEALKSVSKENKLEAKLQRTAAIDRLEALRVAVWPSAMKGNLGAVWAALAIEQQQLSYEKTDKPAEQQKRKVIFSIEEHDDDKATHTPAALSSATSED